MNDLSFDPYDAGQAHNMWEVTRRFRREAPVARIGNGLVFVTKYHDVKHVLATNTVFVNEGNLRRPGVNPPLEDRALGELDPPVHGPIRRLAMSAVTHPSIEGMRDFARSTCETLLDGILKQGRGDLVGKFSVLLTNRVIAKMLGVPLQKGDWLAEQAEAVLKSELPLTNQTERGVGYAGAFPEFTTFIDDLVAKHVGTDDGSAVSRIVSGAAAGGGFAEPRKIARQILIQLMLGGTATTRDLIGHMFYRMIQDPKLHARIEADRSLIPAAVEETIRLDPPVLFAQRTCKQNTTLHGVDLNPGDLIVVCLAAANRDEEVFEDPDSFRVDRPPTHPNLSFGFSSHFCLGSPLARMEGQTALEVFLDKVKPGTLKTIPGFQIQRMPTPFLYGPVSLDVESATLR